MESLSEVVPEKLLGKHKTFFKGRGCELCNFTGYIGRAGIHEVLEIDGPVRDAILKKAPANEIRDIAMQNGMVSMIVDGFHKAAAGLTSIEEVLRMRYE